MPTSARHLSFALKAFGFLLLAFILVQPEWISESNEEEVQKGVHLLALLGDNGQGLILRDKDAQATRGQTLLNSVTDTSWRDELDDIFQTREYLFDVRLRRAPLTSATFNGQGSNLQGALNTLRQRFDGHPLAGIVVFTDGNATDDFDPSILTNLPPVYPFLLGSDTPQADLGLGQITVTQTAFEEAPVTILAEAHATGIANRPVTAELVDHTGASLHTHTWTPTKTSTREVIRFTHRPPLPGVTSYEIRLRPGTLTNKTAFTENTTLNNTRHLSVNRGRGPYRVLYVSGRPNWEFKFLNRALQSDREVELVGLIRIAKREPKFSFRGRAGESSNPLFRGFGTDTGEDPEYDQPVLVRFNTANKDELADGFPTEAGDLFPYHAIILDDVEAEFFTPDQQTLIAQFVSERGGGFLALGGQECFQHGSYADTPLGDLLPVYTETATTLPPDATFRLDLTREGWLQPWIRLRNTEAADRARLETMPAFQSAHALTAIKPGASVIASALHRDSRHPALVAQRFGSGRSAALLIADLWRWGMQNPDQRDDMNKSWRQLVRWLIADVPAHIELTTTPSAGMRLITLTVRDADFQPLPEDGIDIQLTLTTPDGTTIPLTALPSTEQVGTWEAATKPTTNGSYRVTASLHDKEGNPLGTTEAGWAENPLADEFARLTPNRPLLQRLADQTGGRLLSLRDLNQLANEIPHPTIAIKRSRTLALWNLPLLFILALLCFLTEWWLRRTKGAA